MIFLYNLLTFLYLPVAILKLFYKKNFSFKEFKRIKERFGSLKINEFNLDKRFIWIHAVSVGEVNTSVKLIKKLQKDFPNKNILVTTTTETGSSRLKKIFKDDIYHQYLPFDVAYFVKKFINLLKLDCLILIETEIWPNLIIKCFNKKIPIILLNGRLSKKSLNKYKRFKNLSHQVFSKINLIIAQSNEDKINFAKIGANLSDIHVESSLKFDALDAEPAKPSFSFSAELINNKKIIVCASTHPNEEEILFKSFKILNDASVHLVLVPRHPHRAKSVGNFLKKENSDFSFLQENENFNLDLNKKVTVVNEIGHLNFLYSISDLAFIGGTLIEHGGQNFLEPVKYGIPISSGNSVYNFQEIADQLCELNILKYGNTAEEISSIWKIELNKKNKDIIKQACSEYILSQQGSLSRSAKKIKEHIK